MVSRTKPAVKDATTQLAESLDRALAQGGAAGEIEESDLESELRELAGARVRVSRVTGVRGEPGGFMFSVDADGFNLDDLLTRIRDEYGGGTYRIRVFHDGGFKMNRNLEVAAPLKPPAATVVAPAQGGDRFAELVMSMQENTRAMLDNMRDQQVMAAQNTQEMMIRVVESIASNNHAPTQSPTDFLGILTLAKELFGGKKNDDPMKSFLEGINFAKAAGGGDDNPVGDMVKALAAPLMALVGGAQNGAQVARLPVPQQQRLAPAHNPGSVQPPPAPMLDAAGAPIYTAPMPEVQAPAVAVDEQKMIMVQWKPYLNMLLAAAAVDGNQETYADMILDMAPAEQVVALIEEDENFAKFMEQLPEVTAELRPWFDVLRATLLRFVAEMAEDASDENNVSGQPGPKDVPDGPGDIPTA